MANPRTGCAASLIEVSRVLVQQRRQYGATDHDVRKTIGGHCAQSLSKRSPTLPIIWRIACLPGTGNQQHSSSGYRVGRDFQRELKFHLCGKRLNVGIIGDVEVWNDSEHALMFLGLELLDRDLCRIIVDV